MVFSYHCTIVCEWCSKNTMVLLFAKSDVKYLPCPKLFLYSNISQWLSPRWCVTFPAWHEHYYPQISLVCSRWVCGVCVHTSCRYSQTDDDGDGVLKSWVCPCSSPDWEESPQSSLLYMRALRPVILFSPARHAELELDSRLWTATGIAKSMLWFVLWHMKSSDAKASKVHLEFSSKISILLWLLCLCTVISL